MFNVSEGVHQAAVTSMIVYAMFINSRLVELREAKLGCYTGGTYVGSSCFADDQALVTLFNYFVTLFSSAKKKMVDMLQT